MISEFKDLTDDEVVFFIRNRGKASYFKNTYTHKFLERFENVKKFRTISEYRKDATYHIDLNAEKDTLSKEQWKKYHGSIDFSEVIGRCRALRSISYMEALSLIFRAINYFEDFFQSQNSLKLIVMGTVDNYVMDLMERFARMHGVECFAITDSFMSPKYKLSSVRGEANYVSSPSDEDVSEARKDILDRIQSAKRPSQWRMVKRALYTNASYKYQVTVRYIFKYLMFGRLEYGYRFAPYFKASHVLWKLLAVFYLKKNLRLHEKQKPIAYVPLHYVPEATVDYWVEDEYDYDYERSLFDVIEKLQTKGFTVVVKEHPAFQFSRDLSFYRHLKLRDVVVLCGTVPTAKVFDAAELVVVWNGSTGIEAALYGKPVVRVTNSYYGDSIDTLETFLKTSNASVPDGRLLLKRALECSVRCI